MMPPMATVETITLTCDGCGTDEGDIETHRIKVDRKRPADTDLCGTCWDFVRRIVAAGRPATRAAAA